MINLITLTEQNISKMDAMEKIILSISKEDRTVINEEKGMFHLFFHACRGY
jgi:hypothetical protein